MLGGRPTKYSSTMLINATKFAKLGLTDAQMAGVLGVSESTFNKWKIDYPEFSESIKKAKSDLDGNVRRSLYERATGYSHPEDKIFNNNGEAMVVSTTKHYPPDPVSMIFWLKNRDPGHWRDKQEIEHSGDIEVIFNIPRPPKKGKDKKN